MCRRGFQTMGSVLLNDLLPLARSTAAAFAAGSLGRVTLLVSAAAAFAARCLGRIALLGSATAAFAARRFRRHRRGFL